MGLNRDNVRTITEEEKQKFQQNYPVLCMAGLHITKPLLPESNRARGEFYCAVCHSSIVAWKV